jgi:uncharacterized protein YbjT (DUF2867 family)
MSTTLIIGASGTVGTELGRLLRLRGDAVRLATSRLPETPAHVRIDLGTGAGLEQAFEGVGKAFFLSPPGYTNQDVILGRLIDRAARNRLERVVLMTAMGADASDEIPLRKAEMQLLRSSVPATIIRPNWFMQNFDSYWSRGIREEGKILLPVGQARGSFIDARDIAAVAAALLADADHSGMAFDLTGPEALDHAEVASILSKVTGREIIFEDITPDAMLGRLLAAGLPRDYAEFLIVILGYFKAGAAAKITDSVERITGRPPRSFATYAADYWSKAI